MLVWCLWDADSQQHLFDFLAHLFACNECQLVAAGDAGVSVGAVPREDALDRFAYHTAVCPDSMAAFTNFSRAHAVLKGVTAVGAVALISYSMALLAGGAALDLALLKPAAGLGAAAAATAFCGFMANQFTYVYTPDKARKDVAKIPKLTEHL